LSSGRRTRSWKRSGANHNALWNESIPRSGCMEYSKQLSERQHMERESDQHTLELVNRQPGHRQYGWSDHQKQNVLLWALGHEFQPPARLHFGLRADALRAKWHIPVF